MHNLKMLLCGVLSAPIHALTVSWHVRSGVEFCTRDIMLALKFQFLEHF